MPKCYYDPILLLEEPENASLFLTGHSQYRLLRSLSSTKNIRASIHHCFFT